MSQSLEMKDEEFYQGHLDGVSRSFAFCIRKLEYPLRRWTSLSYLLCRVLDTIEDSPWGDKATQLGQYDKFEGFLTGAPASGEVRAWASRFPVSIPTSEKALLADAEVLFRDLQGLPERVRADIREVVLRMERGMRRYSAQAELKLRNLPEVNQYCYFVAGIVGELLSKLFVAYRPDFRPGRAYLKDAFHFGLFLQKVNLLKDQKTDERDGRFLMPDRTAVLSSLRDHARGALRYIASLPLDERGYRTFCAWSLFLGLASLPYIERSFTEQSGIKISRDEAQALLSQIELHVCDNEALLAQGETCLHLLPSATTAAAPASQDNEWFHRISGDVLGSEDLAEIGIPPVS